MFFIGTGDLKVFDKPGFLYEMFKINGMDALNSFNTLNLLIN